MCDAESLQRSVDQLRQGNRAAEMHPSVARPRISVTSVTPALPTLAVVFERIIHARIPAGFGDQCRRPWLRAHSDGFKDFTEVLWLEELMPISGSVVYTGEYIHVQNLKTTWRARLGVTPVTPAWALRRRAQTYPLLVPRPSKNGSKQSLENIFVPFIDFTSISSLTSVPSSV